MATCDCRKSYTHEVPVAVRRLSKWDDDLSVFVAPDGRAYVYSDATQTGGSLRCGHGNPVSTARYCAMSADELRSI